MHIILQPCGDVYADRNFKYSIANENLKLEYFMNYISREDYQNLKQIYPDGNIKVWGVLSTNFSKWTKINVGDVALFTAKKHVNYSSVITYKIHNERLAKVLWGNNEKGQTWELMYFVDEVSKFRLPYEVLNRFLGYSLKNIVRGFSVVNEEKSSNFLSMYSLESDRYLDSQYTNETYLNALKKEKNRIPDFGENLNRDTKGSSRIEQSYLRREMFGNNYTGKCSICGRELPVQFLWCSHIKKRSKCTLEEMLDYKNIVTPMCKLGCDDLFEKGFIGVEDGIIKPLKKANNKPLDDYIDSLTNKTCEAFNDENAKYFKAHIKSFCLDDEE